MYFVLIHCQMYQRILQVSFLYTSLNDKFTLAARARAAEHARARRGAAAARPANCVERLANLPLLADLGSVVVQAGVVVCCDDWPAMLNGWFGWLSSLAPVAGPTESVAEEELAACGEASDEEALLGTHPVPHGSIAAVDCLSCVDQAGKIDPPEEEGGTSSGSENVSRHHTCDTQAPVLVRRAHRAQWWHQSSVVCSRLPWTQLWP